jgi:sec-independent protein translocase protein TatA
MIAMFGMSGPWEWIVVLVIVLIFFGVGKLPNVLGQMGKGVKAFKDGMTDDEKDADQIDVTDAVSEPEAQKVSEAEEIR